MFTAHASHALLQFFNGSLSSSYSNFQIYIEGYGNGGFLLTMGRALKIWAWARPGLEPCHEFRARGGPLPPRSLYAGQHNILFQQHYPRLCTFSRSSYQRISKCNMNLLIHLLLNELKLNKF